jgi:hypothetical protein
VERSVSNGNIHSKYHDSEASGHLGNGLDYTRHLVGEYHINSEYLNNIDFQDIVVKFEPPDVYLLRHRQRYRQRVHGFVRWCGHLYYKCAYRLDRLD